MPPSTTIKRPTRTHIQPSPFQIKTHSKKHHAVLNASAPRPTSASLRTAAAHHPEQYLHDIRDQQRPTQWRDARLNVNASEGIAAAASNAQWRQRHQRAEESEPNEPNTLLTHQGAVLLHGEQAGIKDNSSDLVNDVNNTPALSHPRTHQEIMQEVMAKSKLAKHERQEASLQQLDRAVQIDRDFVDVKHLLKTKTQAKLEDHGLESAIVTPQDDEADRVDDFVLFARQLAEEARVQASDRVKTEQEVAQEAKLQLELSEKERLARMNQQSALHELSEYDLVLNSKAPALHAATDAHAARTKDQAAGSRRKLKRDAEKAAKREAKAATQAALVTSASKAHEYATGDDLDVNYLVEDSAVEIASEADDADTSASSPFAQTLMQPRTSAKRKRDVDVESDTPFVFPAPQSHQHLLSILEPHPLTVHALILTRIHAYHAAVLSPENRVSMERFYGILLQHADHQFLQPESEPSMSVLNAIAVLLSHLLQALPMHGAQASRARLLSCKIVVDDAAQIWSHLFQTHLACVLFPISDYRHSVVTTAMLFLAQFLFENRLAHSTDLCQCLFALQMCNDAFMDSKRLMPEAVHCLTRISVWWSAHEFGFLHYSVPTDAALPPIRFSQLFVSSTTAPNFKMDVSLARSCFAWFLQLVDGLSQVLLQSEAFVELFGSLLINLQALSLSDIGPTSSELSRTCHLLKHRLHTCAHERSPLSLDSVTLPMRTHNPAFHADYQPGRSYDPIKERAQNQRLQREAVQEKKAAQKEVSRATQSQALLHAAQSRALADERKRGRLFNFTDMQRQAADTNVLHKSKQKKK